MKKWKNLSRNEKWMIIFIIILLIGILIRWTTVKEGVGRGFNWFLKDEAPADTTELKITVDPDTFPVDNPQLIILGPENE